MRRPRIAPRPATLAASALLTCLTLLPASGAVETAASPEAATRFQRVAAAGTCIGGGHWQLSMKPSATDPSTLDGQLRLGGLNPGDKWSGGVSVDQIHAGDQTTFNSLWASKVKRDGQISVDFRARANGITRIGSYAATRPGQHRCTAHLTVRL